MPKRLLWEVTPGQREEGMRRKAMQLQRCGRQAPSPAGRFRRPGQCTADRAVPDEQGRGPVTPAPPHHGGLLSGAEVHHVTGELRGYVMP